MTGHKHGRTLKAWGERDRTPRGYDIDAAERRQRTLSLHEQYRADPLKCPKCSKREIVGGHCQCGYVYADIRGVTAGKIKR